MIFNIGVRGCCNTTMALPSTVASSIVIGGILSWGIKFLVKTIQRLSSWTSKCIQFNETKQGWRILRKQLHRFSRLNQEVVCVPNSAQTASTSQTPWSEQSSRCAVLRTHLSIPESWDDCSEAHPSAVTCMHYKYLQSNWLDTMQ